MRGSKLNRGDIHRCPSAAQRLRTLLVLGCWVIAAGVCLADVIVKVNVRQSSTTTTGAFDVNFSGAIAGTVAALPPCPEVLAALVLNNGETLTMDVGAVVQDGDSGFEFEIDPPLPTGVKNLLASRLQTDGLYNPVIHDLAFVFFIPITCVGVSHIEVEYGVRDGANNVVLPSSLVAGGATLEELFAGGPLLSFESVDAPVERTTIPNVPALSEWGVLALTLILFVLVIGKTYSGTRRAQTLR